MTVAPPSLSATTLRGRLPRRLLQLVAGLALLGLATGLLVRGGLGLTPWAVLHEGLSVRLGISLGAATIGVGLVLLVAWIPLRERPGIGTVANVVLVGGFVDLALRLLPEVDGLVGRAGCSAAGVVLTALALATYLGVRLGPGPRDGVMTALVRLTGRSIRLVRTAMEAVVVVAGLLLGGTAGVATLVFVVSVGPLTQLFVGPLRVRLAGDGTPPTPSPVGE